MARTSGEVLVQYVVAIILLLIALVGGSGTKAATICNIDSTKLSLCLPAVSGESPPPPTEGCCTVVRHCNLPCLCNYKSVLPSFGINPAHAITLPKKCGLKTPLECHVG